MRIHVHFSDDDQAQSGPDTDPEAVHLHFKTPQRKQRDGARRVPGRTSNSADDWMRAAHLGVTWLDGFLSSVRATRTAGTPSTRNRQASTRTSRPAPWTTHPTTRRISRFHKFGRGEVAAIATINVLYLGLQAAAVSAAVAHVVPIAASIVLFSSTALALCGVLISGAYALSVDFKGVFALRGAIPWSRMSPLGWIIGILAWLTLFPWLWWYYCGHLVVEAFQRDPDRRQRIAYETARLEADLGMVDIPLEGTCATCERPLVAGAPFCAFCGAETQPRPHICPVCATHAPADAHFCPQCRTVLD